MEHNHDDRYSPSWTLGVTLILLVLVAVLVGGRIQTLSNRVTALEAQHARTEAGK
jgi:hypothetical protein